MTQRILVLAVVSACVWFLATSSVTANPGEPTRSTPEAGAGNYCQPLFGFLADSVRVVHGLRPGGTETTEFSPVQGYRVTQCDDFGNVVRVQVVGPIVVPGGQVIDLPWVDYKRLADGTYAALFATYGDPKDPVWLANWHGADAARQGVIAPTSNDRAVAERGRDANGQLSEPRPTQGSRGG